MEYWYNGLSRFPSVSSSQSRRNKNNANARISSPGGSESGYIEVEASTSEDQVNGEKVEMEMTRERKVQKVRSWIAAVGFAMGVVGIWGDGA